MEIQRADPRLRRLAGLLFVTLAIVGAAALLALQDWLSAVTQAAPSIANAHLLAAFSWLIGTSCVALLVLAICVWRTASQVLAAARFPPPDMRVVRDTIVLYGTAASRRGRIIQGISAFLVLCCIALAVALWRLHLVFSSHLV